MSDKKTYLKKGITFHQIQTNKFKTDVVAVFITTPLSKEEVTYNAILPAVLRRGTMKTKTQEEINKKLEEMYGAEFNCGIDKTGDNQVLKFYIESLNNQYGLDKEDIIKQSISLILEIVFNPLVENNALKKEYVEGEKNNLKQLIEEKIDNKAKYSYERCVEEMYKDKPYGLYKYGYIEDLDKINEKNLYEHYKKLINESKIDIFISGEIEEDIIEQIRNNENIEKLSQREPNYKLEGENAIQNDEKVITESMNISQGKLVMGLDVGDLTKEETYDAIIYNAILGIGSNSKLFQNVREKASLAYTASSSYIRRKGNIFIKCGIEIQNYEKAVEIIKKQLEDMKNGKFEEEDIENAKKVIISTVSSINEEQDSEITYYFGHEITKSELTIEEYMEKIKNVKKENIIKVANKIKINTIYFLRD